MKLVIKKLNRKEMWKVIAIAYYTDYFNRSSFMKKLTASGLCNSLSELFKRNKISYDMYDNAKAVLQIIEDSTNYWVPLKCRYDNLRADFCMLMFNLDKIQYNELVLDYSKKYLE